MVKGEDGLHNVGDPGRAAAELSQEAPALQDGHGLLADAVDQVWLRGRGDDPSARRHSHQKPGWGSATALMSADER